MPNRREYRCSIFDASTEALALTAPASGKVGDTVVLYVDTIGRIEGRIVRCRTDSGLTDGFVIQIAPASRAAQEVAKLVERKLAGRQRPQ